MFGGSSVAAGDQVSVQLDGIINPTTGSKSLQVATTSDTTPVPSSSYSIGGPPPSPTVTGVTPTSGPAAGGTSVTITGTDFTGATAVKFGAASATFTLVNASEITATAPPGAAGTVDIIVTTPQGSSSPGAGDHFTYQAVSRAITATGGFTFTGTAPAAVSGTLATFTVPDHSATASDFSASVDWGDGRAPAPVAHGRLGELHGRGRPHVQRGRVVHDHRDDHRGRQPGQLGERHGLRVGRRWRRRRDHRPADCRQQQRSRVLGLGQPAGRRHHRPLRIRARRQVQPIGGPADDHTTPDKDIGGGFSPVPVSASASSLLPNALYHVRLVATNINGTTVGADQTFQTSKDPAPPAPVIAKTLNVSVTSGVVFIKPPPGKSLGFSKDVFKKGHGFLPLTEPRSIPNGSEVDARRGALKLVTVTRQRW